MSLEIRNYELRAVDQEKREVTGLAVPYGSSASAGGYTEAFERGAIEDVTDVKLFWNHNEPIGRVVRGEDTEDGFLITAVISKTSRGDEAWTLVKDGVINKFSVGFLPVEHRMEKDTVVRTKVNLKEVSLVPFPAYEGASLTEIREATTAIKAEHNTKEIDERMSDNVNAPEVAELREAVGDLERQVRSFVAKGNEKSEGGSQFRSGAEWLKALANGNEAAKAEVRAYTGGTFADNDNATRPAWIAKALQLVEEKRPVTNLFGRAALPSTGMSYQYPQVTAATGTVGVQAAEGDDLPYLEVTVGTATADVKVLGGYTSLSRQEIERTEVGILEANLRHLYNQYARASEAQVRAALLGADTQDAVLAADTAVAWLDAVIDGAGLIEDNAKGAAAEFVMVSRDVFKRLAHIVDTAGRPVFVINGDGVNTFGDANVRGQRGTIAGFPVVVAGGLPANSLYVASSEALTVREDATKSLQDENIINLTKDFSVYGYLSVDVSNPLAVVKFDADLGA